MLCGAERSAYVSRETAPWTAATLCCSKPAINKDAVRSRCSSSVGPGSGRLAPKTGATLHLGRLMLAGVLLAASHTRSRISICVWGNLERAVWRCSASLFHVKQRGVFWWRAGSEKYPVRRLECWLYGSGPCQASSYEGAHNDRGFGRFT